MKELMELGAKRQWRMSPFHFSMDERIGEDEICRLCNGFTPAHLVFILFLSGPLTVTPSR